MMDKSIKHPFCTHLSVEVIEIPTDQLEVKLYRGNYLGSVIERKNRVYNEERTGLCLDCRNFPDLPSCAKVTHFRHLSQRTLTREHHKVQVFRGHGSKSKVVADQ